MKSIPIILICGCFLFAACSEFDVPQDKLPPATTQGLETFGCQVNGNVWIPKNSLGLFGYGTVLYFLPEWGDSDVTIYATNYWNNPHTSITIRFFHANRLGSIQDSDISLDYTSDNSKPGQDNYEYTNRRMNSSHIELLRSDWISPDTLQTKKGIDTTIISGLFSGTLFNGRGDSVVIQEGRFDLSTAPK
ncbi:MAG: hypothetical protein ACHQM6_06830 [Candidatus Kapaibacterium sp.]